MGLETATKPSELVLTNPTSSDLRTQGDDHLRLIKTVLQNLGKTSPCEWSTETGTSFTAVAGKGYIATNGSAVTATLPASPSAGDTVGFVFTNGLTTNVISRNSQPICSLAENMTVNVNTSSMVLVLTYVDATRGWVLQ